MAALPAYRPELVLELVHGAGRPLRMLEPFARSELQQVTPGLAALASVAAIEGCDAAHKGRPQAEIDQCIADALRLSNLAVVPR